LNSGVIEPRATSRSKASCRRERIIDKLAAWHASWCSPFRLWPPAVQDHDAAAFEGGAGRLNGTNDMGLALQAAGWRHHPCATSVAAHGTGEVRRAPVGKCLWRGAHEAPEQGVSPSASSTRRSNSFASTSHSASMRRKRLRKSSATWLLSCRRR
jgi:hypothetical protein